MSKKENNNTEQQPENTEEQSKKSYVFMYIAIGCFAVGCILLALSFVIRGAGVHFLIASMISELAAVSFINAQKKRVNTKACLLISILSYAVMAAALIIFIVGIGVGSSAK